MDITIIGSGYVGLVAGACFADKGNKVTCVDIDPIKIEKLNRGVIPIFEPGLESIVLKNLKNRNLCFKTDLHETLQNAEMAFIAVGTPMGEDGSADLKYVLAAAKSIGQSMQKKLIVVNKSTVPIGTADKVKMAIRRELNKRNSDLQFDVVSNPEFLKEGSAIADFIQPDRVILGVESDYALGKMKQLYNPFCKTSDRLISMDVRSAEMTKYAANAMLASKISFINEIANICERVGADVNQVRIGIGSDQRIGYSFINPGAGYGGSCFPKDVKALIKIAAEHDYNARLISAVEKVNDAQKFVLAQKIVMHFGEDLSGLTFAMWGLAFKPGTDDMREAPSIYVIKELIIRGAKVRAYDPKAIEESKEYYLRNIQNVTYVHSKYEALKGANALVLLTEWEEFRSPNFEEIKSQLRTPVIFDGRNQYIDFDLASKGFIYYRIGK
jgi:UDPglucose 6-dehydrogenase